jgi:CRP-like cAMP-binding protein
VESAPGTKLFKNAAGGERILAGTTIFRAGDPGDAMYVVQQGEVDIIVSGTVVATVGPDGMFGEMALLDREPRSTDAVAKTDVVLHRVDAARFMLMVRQTPFFAMDVIHLLAFRLRAMDARLRAQSSD